LLQKRGEKIDHLPDKWLSSFKKKEKWIRCKDRGILVVWSLGEDNFFKKLYGKDFIRHHLIGEKYRC
jgi:hypothetical protein